MRLTPKTMALAAISIGLLLVNLVDPGEGPGGSDVSRVLAPVAEADATRIEMSTASEKVVLEKNPQTGRWHITAPLDHPADRALVQGVLHPFRTEVPVDVRVDTGNLAEYGLDASGGVVVEMWAGEDTPAVSFTVGNDAQGGSSFIRISGDDGVYRARLGGRARYDRRAAGWRNRTVLDFEEPQVQGISIKPPTGLEVHLVRGPVVEMESEGTPAPGAWQVDPDPGWGLDAGGLTKLVALLGRLRARQILADDFDGGFSPPAAEITVVRNDGTENVMAVGTQVAEGLTYVRVTGGAAVYAVPVKALEYFLRLDSPDAQERLLFEVPRQIISKLIYWEGPTSVELAPDASSGVWRALGEEPPEIDVADVDWALGQLARLSSDGRMEGLNPVAVGVMPPNLVFEVQRTDGTHEAVYVGRAMLHEGKPHVYVARQNSKEVHIMSQERVTRLQRAFGKR
jgi:hypothetical protein